MITIKKSPTAAGCDVASVTPEQLAYSTMEHCWDVARGIMFFMDMMATVAKNHDQDKHDDIAQFHAAFIAGFKDKEWYASHKKANRHHLLEADGVPADVNLLDVLEYIADCVMGGMARTGTFYPATISPEVLMTAFNNTVELLRREVVVEGFSEASHDPVRA